MRGGSVSRIADFGDVAGMSDVISLAEGVGFGEMGVIGVCRLVRFAGNLLYCDNF